MNNGYNGGPAGGRGPNRPQYVRYGQNQSGQKMQSGQDGQSKRIMQNGQRPQNSQRTQGSKGSQQIPQPSRNADNSGRKAGMQGNVGIPGGREVRSSSGRVTVNSPGTQGQRNGRANYAPGGRGGDVGGRSVTSVRRKATRDQMKGDRRLRRREAGRVFFGRLAIYAVMFVILAGITAGVFFWFFYRTPDANESRITYLESYNGEKTEKTEASGSLVYRNGTLFVNFSGIANGCGMSVIFDKKDAKFVLPDRGDTSDSAGTGHEEYVTFTKDSTECVVCGQDSRLSSAAVFSGKDVWIPADFVTGYVNGITVTEEKDKGIVRVERDKDDQGTLAEVSFRLKAVTGPDTAEPVDLPGTGGMPEVEFSTDLSEYEKYMNPEDAREYLVLVNKTSTVGKDYVPDSLIDVADTRNDREAQKMREYAAKSLEAMFIEMRAAGFTDVSVTSAYRSYDYQEQLYSSYTNQEMESNPNLTREQAEAIVSTYSAKAGTSEHQTGLCCDMHNLASATVEFKDQPVYGWLTENAWKFGFILRFPEDKTDITGYSFEPWHYRFVGRNAAWEIHSKNLCLEEYLG